MFCESLPEHLENQHNSFDCLVHVLICNKLNIKKSKYKRMTIEVMLTKFNEDYFMNRCTFLDGQNG